MNCKMCFNCKAVIPLSYYRYSPKKPGPKVLYGQLQYEEAQIKCAKGMWVNESTGEEKVYVSGLSVFMAGAKKLSNLEFCEYYEI